MEVGEVDTVIPPSTFRINLIVEPMLKGFLVLDQINK